MRRARFCFLWLRKLPDAIKVSLWLCDTIHKKWKYLSLLITSLIHGVLAKTSTTVAASMTRLCLGVQHSYFAPLAGTAQRRLHVIYLMTPFDDTQCGQQPYVSANNFHTRLIRWMLYMYNFAPQQCSQLSFVCGRHSDGFCHTMVNFTWNKQFVSMNVSVPVSP